MPPTPIHAKPSDRDPLRNFKFRTLFLPTGSTGALPTAVTTPLASVGFISISGIGAQTEVIPYREGGDNTTPRKLPGQTDFGTLSFTRGVFMQDNDGGYEWFKQIFALQWGEGNEAFDDEFRFNIRIDVLKHPVTKFTLGGVGDPNSQSSSGMAIMIYNAWPTSIVYNDLNAGDNSIMITSMSVAYEGFDTLFGNNAQNDFPG